jgi:membrane protease YdiL (CAAX protease family)
MRETFDEATASEQPPNDEGSLGASPALDPPESDRSESPVTGWAPWTAPLVLVAAIAAAAVGGLVIDLPALAFGAEVTNSHTPAGLTIAGTFVQDLAFVFVAVWFARLGGRVSRAWQFGLRAPGVGWRSAGRMIVLLLLGFIVFSVLWAVLFEPGEDKVLKSLGSGEGGALLVLSAALTCVVAPIGEEFLFRGYIFTALRGWRGTLPAAALTGLLFGGVHVGSAPVLDLPPLAALGFGLCLLYRYTGSLYPGIVTHCLNNCIAFAGLAGWGWSWEAPVLVIGALGSLWLLARICNRAGLIGSPTGFSAPAS